MDSFQRFIALLVGVILFIVYIFYQIGLLLYGIVLVAIGIFIFFKFTYFGWILGGRIKQVVSLKLLVGKKNFNAANIFEDTVRKYPNKTALLFEDRKYTYKELDEAANQIANWATSIGLKEQDVVGLYMQNRPEFIITWLGLMKVNVITSLINTDLVGIGLTYSLKVCGAKILLMGDELISNYETCLESPIEQVWIWSEKEIQKKPNFQYQSFNNIFESTSKKQPELSKRKEATMNSKAFFIFTSGTTGLPKAAILTHKRVIDIWYSSIIFPGLKEYDTIYVTLPLYHTSGNVIGTSLFSVGGTVALRRKFSASNCMPDCKKFEATCILYIGELLRYLLLTPESPNDKDHKLRMVFGNGLRNDVWDEFQKRFNIPLVNELYSATEGNIQLLNLGKPHAVGYAPPLLHYKIFHSLSPFFLVKFDIEKEEPIRDKNGFCQVCDWNEPGELIGRIDNSPNAAYGNFVGYYNNNEATKKKILENVFTNGDQYFRTGDLLKQDPQGFFHFVDRIGDTFRWKGQNVATGEVGNTLALFNGIQEANVYGVSVPKMEGRAGMASIVGSDINFQELYNYVSQNLTSYSAPLFLRIKKEIENTGTFKNKKADLVKEGFNPNIIQDPLYYKNDAKKTYSPLTKEIYQDIESQKIKF